MSSPIEEIKLGVKRSLNQQYVATIEQQIDDEVQKMLLIVGKIESFYNDPSTELNDFQKIAAYKSQLYAVIDNYWKTPENKQFSIQYAPLIASLEAMFEPLNKKLHRLQKRDRFFTIQTDKTALKFIKPFKRAAFQISTIPMRFVNLFRKDKKNIAYWNHTILYKNLKIRHFLIELMPELTRVQAILFPTLCDVYIKIKLAEDEWGTSKTSEEGETFSAIHRQVKALKVDLTNKINAAIDEILDERVNAFIFDYERSGTLELSNRRFSSKANQKNFKEAEQIWAKQNLEWENAIYALFEDWRTDLEIHTLRNRVLAEFEEFQLAKAAKIQEQIDPKIKAIEVFIELEIEALSKEQVAIQKELKRINYQASKKLDKELVPELSDSLSNQPINNLVNKLELTIKQSVADLSNDHVIVKSNTYDTPLKTEDLQIISPHELIEFETLTVFQNELGSVKKELFNAFEKATADTKDLDHIVTFSLTSAIFSIEEDGKSEPEAKTIALEGLKRALNRLTDTNEKLEENLSKISDHLQQASFDFCNRIMELTINENVRELRLRITKARAKKQAKKAIWEFRSRFIIKRKELQVQLVETFEKTRAGVISLSNKFILTAQKPILTKQVSDFLLEYRQAMSDLPVIYKKLYQIEPLQDLELFEGRETECKAVIDAFSSWETGKFSATVILGEKWGGLTTFINYAIKQANFPYPLRRFSPKKNIYSEQMLIDMMKEIFKNDEFENLDQIANHLNNGSKRIVIIEDLQNLYLRKVGGFETLQLLFFLMTKTYKQVFWVMSTTIYAWQYLTKTVRIPEYFGYVIEMRELTHQQVTNIIWKRNMISGFNILFEVDQARLNDKKFSKLANDDQQEVLKKEFFSSLNNFAKSNVSLALIFWLLSTKHVDDNSITMGSFKNPDLNFLNVLSMEKVYILHALILHDGLTESQLNEVLSTTRSSIKLLLLELLQNGIILQNEDVIMVNPIVYRNLITLLKSKNLIH